MTYWVLHCKHCGGRKPQNIPKEYWLYCSMECKITREEQALQRRLEQMKTHNPEDRHVKSDGELRAMGIIVRSTSTKSPEKAPRKVAKKERKKGKRLCGKCGLSGHNARTCGRSRKDRLRMPHEPAPSRAPFGTDAGRAIEKRVIAAVKKSAKKKTRQYKCGKCGDMGHNARTSHKG